MTSKASWAVEARADKWWQDQGPQEVIDIVEELVDGNIDIYLAARRVCALYELLAKQKPSSITEIWVIVFHAVRAIGQDEGASKRLRDFILAIQLADDVLDQSGEQVKLDEGVVWRDLPAFTSAFRDYCINVVSIYDYTGNWLDQAPALVNASTFGALFLSEAPDPIRMSFFASVALINGLEISYSHDQAQQAIMYIPAAATWLRLAGVSIHKLCVDRYDAHATCGLLETGCKWEWTGRSGFSVERWQFWKRRLGELAVEQSLDEHLRIMAKEAEAEMDSVEQTAT